MEQQIETKVETSKSATGMPPKLVQEIQNGIGAALQGQFSQVQVKVGTNPENLKTVRIVIFPELEEKK